MKRREQLKLFMSNDASALEEEYNSWYLRMLQDRENHSAIKHQPFVIIAREMQVKIHQKAETVVLAIWYEDFQLDSSEQGSLDRAKSVSGASMFPNK
jgi:hypothetical protein